MPIQYLVAANRIKNSTDIEYRRWPKRGCPVGNITWRSVKESRAERKQEKEDKKPVLYAVEVHNKENLERASVRGAHVIYPVEISTKIETVYVYLSFEATL